MTMTRTQSLILAGLAFIGLEILLIVWVDRPLSAYLRTVDAQDHGLIDVFRAYTDLGKSVWYLWPSGIGIIICAIGLRVPDLRVAARQRMLRASHHLLFLFTCVALTGIATDIIKPILGRARPVMMEREGAYGFHPFSFHAAWNSMPSGHATTAFTLACCLIAFFPRQRLLWLALATALAASRVMVNAHYLSDVVAGGMVGFLGVYTLQQLFCRDGIILVMNRIFPIDAPRPKP